MNTIEHTPGPWMVHKFRPDETGVSILAASRESHVGWFFVAVVGGGMKKFTPVETANAHLIAAAPDLLLAARLGLQQIEQERELFLESQCRHFPNDGGPDVSSLDDQMKEELRLIDERLSIVRTAIAKAEGRS